VSALRTLDAALRDRYPRPGERIKQYVIDERREDAWERATCPRFTPAEHDDNTDSVCRNSETRVPWTWLDHDCCYFCGDLHQRYRATPEVTQWLAAKAARVPICADETKLSDEIAPDVALAPHPMLAMLRRRAQ
jgi:hypothetical protein